MLRRPGARIPAVVVLVLGGCSGVADPPVSSTSTTSTTTPATSTTLPSPTTLEVRLTTPSFADRLVFEGGVVTLTHASLPGYEKTAQLEPAAASRLDGWVEAAAGLSLGGVYNDGRGRGGESPFWEYTFSSGGADFEIAFSWFPDDEIPAMAPLVEWVTSVLLAMVRCAPHGDLVERRGCEDWLPSPAEQASLRIGDVVAGAPGPGSDSTGAWRRPAAVEAGLAEQVRETLEPVLRSDAFTGEVTAIVVAVRDDGGFYATAEDSQYERVCFVRWTPGSVLSSCQRLLGDVFWAPGTYHEGQLELVMRPAEQFQRPASARYHQTLNDSEPREAAMLLAGEAGLVVMPDPPPWSLWVEVGELPHTSQFWAMPSAATCTAVGLDPVPEAQSGLPDAVARTRNALVAAAVACDSEALAILAQRCEWCSLHGPLHRWYLRDDFLPVHDAAPWSVGLWPIVQMLGTDFAVIPGGTLTSETDLRHIMWTPILDDPSQDVFVWPAADVYLSRATTPPGQVDAAARINLEAVGRDGFVDAAYCGWSIGIRADGTVLWEGDCWLTRP